MSVLWRAWRSVWRVWRARGPVGPSRKLERLLGVSMHGRRRRARSVSLARGVGRSPPSAPGCRAPDAPIPPADGAWTWRVCMTPRREVGLIDV